jgi:hypothetical protein
MTYVLLLTRRTKGVGFDSKSGLKARNYERRHAIAVDSRGNIYVGENFDARRFQRFLYKGVGRPRAGTIPPTTIVR